jgi:hypothetical protein
MVLLHLEPQAAAAAVVVAEIPVSLQEMEALVELAVYMAAVVEEAAQAVELTAMAAMEEMV